MNENHSDGKEQTEVDFTGGVRGRFYLSDAVALTPVHLESDVVAGLQAQAAREGVSLDTLVNRLLKEDLAALRAR
jgi:hypothetical protein